MPGLTTVFHVAARDRDREIPQQGADLRAGGDFEPPQDVLPVHGDGAGLAAGEP